ncbi:MAG TPA: 4-hydroxythreonine-4-phosphate dehydrogenase PdxA [Chloroflexota bacterium]|nr:4-hydroxythreonine-4-phosphate dehydrogenase PdxA [Chloroflexota bacterium]
MSETRAERPLLAITMGDPAGVGPEVTVKALMDGELTSLCRPLVIGDARVLGKAAAAVGAPRALSIRTWERAGDAPFDAHGIDVLDLANVDPSDWAWGKLSAGSGKAALEYIYRAMELVDSGEAAGIVTAPINKEACALAGSKELGHMELFARVYQSKNQATMLVSGKLRCVHLSTHYSLREALNRITRERILQRLETTHEDFRRWGKPRPKIAVSAINPHGGEHGLMGNEEQEEMAPAVTDAQAMGIDARGPYPADSVFVRAMRGEFDAVIAMFHDQGHIPVKVHGFEQSVSVALGLPIVRTSVDHGTAFDIAGKGVADALSMRESIRVAAEICAGTWLTHPA